MLHNCAASLTNKLVAQMAGFKSTKSSSKHVCNSHTIMMIGPPARGRRGAISVLLDTFVYTGISEAAAPMVLRLVLMGMIATMLTVE